MRIGIIQRFDCISTRKIKEEIEKLGHECITINDVYADMTDMSKDMRGDIDLYYYYAGFGKVSRICIGDYIAKTKKIPFINESFYADPNICEKIYQAYRVSKYKINIPKTIAQPRAKFEKISEILGVPFIMKASDGSCGTKVYLINNKEEMDVARAAMIKDELLYQKFIRNDGDYRIHILNGKAVCGYKRSPASGDFRANVSRGGAMNKITDLALQQKLFSYSEKIAKIFRGAEIVGVDLMQDLNSGEIYFIEINPMPGIIEVAEVTGVNIAELMAKYFIKRSVQRKFKKLFGLNV